MKYIKTFTLSLAFLLSACGSLQKAGIEKRLYRPGFYFDRLSEANYSPAKNTVSASTQVENKALSGKVPDSSIVVASIKNDSSYSVKEKIATCHKIKRKNIQASPSDNFKEKLMPEIKPGFFRKKEYGKTISSPHHFRTWGDLLAYLVLLLIVSLIAILLVWLFPTLSTDLAFLFAFLIVLGICLLILGRD